MTHSGRICVAALLFATFDCKPSAMIRHASPIASLEEYRTVLVRVGGNDFTAGYVPDLEFSSSNRLRTSCQFDNIVLPGQALTDVDLIADLTIQHTKRDNEGLVRNQNVAIVDVTMVLSDARENEILGSAEIRGKSSEFYTGSGNPEIQAMNAVAERVASIMVKSGCSGPRIARAAPPVNTHAPSPILSADPETKKIAEELNDQGKEKFRTGDIAGAKQLFEQAVQTSNDARFVFNLCLAQEGLHEYDAALSTCGRVVEMNQEARLVIKAKERIDIIETRKEAQ